jgi:Lipase (class 3)
MKVLNTSNYNAYPVTAMALANIAYNVVDAAGNVEVDLPFDNKPELITPAVLAAAGTSPADYNPAIPNYEAGYVAPFTPVPATIVWGPAYVSGLFVGDISLMYIAQVTGSDEYFVVIRGTSYTSLSSWLTEDLSVYSVMPFNSLNPSPGVAENITISQAAYTGMSNLLGLTAIPAGSTTAQTALQFLQGVLQTSPAAYIYVTGHSLGGALTPVMFAYLNAILFNGSTAANMALWSFAGPTAGGQNFNSLVDSLNTTGFLWRIQNSLDVVPLMFTSNGWSIPADLSGIYSSNHLPMDPAATQVFTQLFQYATDDWTAPWSPPPLQISKLIFISMPAVCAGGAAPGTGFYAQPADGNTLITGTFQTSPPPVSKVTSEWVLQAAYQHHSTTYYQMVAQYFNCN